MTGTTDFPRDAAIALSPEQRALAAYAEPVSLLAQLDGAPAEAALRAAVEAAAAAIPAAHLVFGEVPGFRGLRQALAADAAGSWTRAEDATQTPQALYAAWRAQLGARLAAGEHAGLHALYIAQPGGAASLALAASPLLADDASLQRWLDAALAPQAVAPPDDEAPFDYASYVAWRQDLETDEGAPAARDHWRAHLAAPAGALRLALRNDAPGQGDGMPLNLHRALGDDARAALELLAQRLALPAAEVVHAVWLAVLGRLGGAHAFLSGWSHDCRADYDMLADAVGAYEKVLPLRVEWQADAAFADWAAALAATRQAHRAVQEYWPVDAPPTVEHLAHGFVHRAWRAGAAPVTLLARSGPAPFELALVATDDRHGRIDGIALHAAAGAYAVEALEVLLAHVVQSLLALGRDAALPLDQLPPADAASAVLHGPALAVGERSLLAHIEQWAARTPAAPAVIDAQRGVTLDYAGLVAQATTLAAALREQGVAEGDTIGVHLPRGAALIVAMLAAWRCGAAYLPLDPAWPRDRIRGLLRDAGATCVVSDAATHDALGVPVLTPQARARGEVTLALDAPLSRNAYVLYTSGSTGKPKGVPVSQRALLNYVAAVGDALALSRWRRWAMTATIAADLGNTAVFGALHHGAALVVAPEAALHDADAFARFVRDHEIDAIKMVPSHLAALIEGAEPALPACVVLGGEATPRALLERICAIAPDCAVYNHYGPTETTVGVMVHAVRGPHDTRGEVLPLSQVLANGTVQVLAPDRRPVPLGALGELYIGGAQVAQGYLGQDSAAAFLSDPRTPGALLYRSGDLAYALPGGLIRLAGRADHQLKIRGFRVEPAEIEAALLAQPGVRQAVVLPVGDAAQRQLAACVTADAPIGDGRALREALAGLLPEAMVPARFVAVAAMPRLDNGKVDRRALGALLAEPDAGAAAAPARDALEQVVAASVAALLERPQVGIHDDFFQLGGHSLLVIKLVTRLRKQLRVEVEPGVVFDHPTVAQLAQALRAAAPDPAALDDIAAARVQLAALDPQARAALATSLAEPA